MIPFTVVMVDELRNGPAKVALAERNHLVEALLFDGADEALRVRVRIRCRNRRQHDANSRLAEPLP